MLQDDRAVATDINNDKFLLEIFSGQFFQEDDPDVEWATVTCPDLMVRLRWLWLRQNHQSWTKL